MKLLLSLLLVDVILWCCPTARADSIPGRDPEVIIAGGKGSFPVGSIFSFISPTGTSPINLLGGSPCFVGIIPVLDCVFQNASGSTWTSLTFDTSPTGQLPPFLCVSLAYFSTCSFNSNGTEVTFSGGAGIAAGKDFTVLVLLWLPHTKFSGTAQLAAPAARTPEPSTAGLLLIAVAALLARRRFLGNRFTRELSSSC